MAITKRPQAASAAAQDAFIAQAPDAQAHTQVPALSNARGKQSQITLTLLPELLARVDAKARSLNLSRAGFIKMSLTKALED